MKHPAMLNRQKTGLIIIDMQEKFAPAIPSFNSLTANITKLILGFQLFKMPCVVTEQYPRGLGPTVEPVRQMFPLLEIIEKNEFACTDNDGFWKVINPLHLETFVVCGVESHVCISQTVFGLLAKKLCVHVVVDAIGSRKSLDHEIALKKMEQAGAIMTTTEMALFELVETAGTESFKTIQKALKIAGPIVVQNVAKETPKRAVKPPVAAAQHPRSKKPAATILPASLPGESVPRNAQPDVVNHLTETMAEFELESDIVMEPPLPEKAIDLSSLSTPEPSAPSVNIVEESTINTAAKVFNESDHALESIDADLAALDLSLPAGNVNPTPASSSADEIDLEDLNSLLDKESSPTTTP